MGTIRKLIESGLDVASDIRLTHQAKDYLSKQAQKGKEEVTKVLAREMKKFLQQVKVHEEIQKALSGLSLQIEAKINIVPSNRSESPKISMRVRRGSKF